MRTVTTGRWWNGRGLRLLGWVGMLCASMMLSLAATRMIKKIVWLPSSKMVEAPGEGFVTATNGLPVTVVVSPDGRYVAALFAGYGAESSGRRQSIGVFDLTTGKYQDFPDERFKEGAAQSYFVGLAFGGDGARLYASVVSMTDVGGVKKNHLGNGIAVYSFKDGVVAPEKFLPLPQAALAAGKFGARGLHEHPEDAGKIVPYPAGIAVIHGASSDELLVAENLADDAVMLDAATGAVQKRFDLSLHKLVPGTFPYGVAVSSDGRRAWVSLWNEAKLAELDVPAGRVSRWIALPGTERASSSPHATAMTLSGDGKRLYVALANADAVVAVDTAKGEVVTRWSTKMAGQEAGGSSPLSVALSTDGKRLFAANAGTNSVAVLDTQPGDDGKAKAALGFIPTDWYPTAVVVHGNDLIIASGKGQGTGPNKPVQDMKDITAGKVKRSELPYIPTLLQGSLARLPVSQTESRLADLTAQARQDNLLDAATVALPANAKKIKHVIYIIKENRTYDQILGDLGVGNGDSSLTLFGEEVTPNQHKLALQFGVLDNFYDSGEVSADGHEWSNAATTSDYNEKTWPIAYRAGEHSYDYEGTVLDEYPLHWHISDVDEPGTGYLWNNLARHGVSYRHYGEFIATEWCEDPRKKKARQTQPREGTIEPTGGECERAVIRKGDPLPARLGGGASPYPWAIPVIKRDVATKADLLGHFDEHFPDFNPEYPDQLRVDEFLLEFTAWQKARAAGNKDEMPQFIQLRIPNDHTSGKKPNAPTPAAAVADNDLAVGRVVEAISNSPYWDDTAIMILEDDAQDAADHVDAHRSTALVISKYAPGSAANPAVEHGFYTTVSMIRTMEALLGLPPMNVNDAYAPVMTPLFAGGGKQAPFKADHRNWDNGLIFETNKRRDKGAEQSSKMDFRHADAADSQTLNAILWHDRKGNTPMPPPKHTVIAAGGGE